MRIIHIVFFPRLSMIWDGFHLAFSENKLCVKYSLIVKSNSYWDNPNKSM